MNTVILVLVALSLVLSAVAYWRSGGARDVQKLRAEIDALRLKQKELAENITSSLSAAYTRSRERLQAVRENLRRQKAEAVEGMEKQLQLAHDQLEALGHRLEESAGSIKSATFSTAQKIEEAIALRVRRIEARVTLLHAKAKVARAQSAAEKSDFQRADELLADAADLWHSVRETLGDDRTYDPQLDALKRALRDATAAVRARAQDSRSRIDRVLADTDRIVGALESDEARAASTSQA
jgi:flagellin-specific chaperone FliS